MTSTGAGATPDPPLPHGSHRSATVNRNLGFSGVVGSTAGTFIYAFLPQSVRANVPIHEFVIFTAGAATVLHRGVVAVWDFLLGDVSREAKNALLMWIRLRQIEYYLMSGAMSAEQAEAAKTKLLERNLLRDLGS